MLPRSLNLCCCVVASAIRQRKWGAQQGGATSGRGSAQNGHDPGRRRERERPEIRWTAKKRALRAVLPDDVRQVSVGESVRRCILTNFDQTALWHRVDVTRIVTCDMAFLVREPAELVMQVVAASSAGHVEEERFDVLTDGEPPSSMAEVGDPEGATMHIIRSDPGHLTVTYRARIRSSTTKPRESANHSSAADVGDRQTYERQVYLRPSRYCPSEHLVGFAVAEFGTGPDMGKRICRIAEWIRQRIEYVPGSGTVHDSAEDTLLTGEGTCRDFAHLGIALCRATGVPARFAAVYAPGLDPMDFHAVFEAFENGRWYVHDPTGLAPRASLVRIATGRDAADAAFAAVTRGLADLQSVDVTAVAEPFLLDDVRQLLQLA